MNRLLHSNLLLLIALVVSLSLNALQGTRILKLEDRMASGKSTLKITSGSIAPELKVIDGAGKESVLDIRSSQTPTLLYVLSPNCIWCRRNADSVRALFQHARNLRIVGLSLSTEGLEAFAAETGVEFPIFTAAPSTIDAYGLGETPTTILIASDGAVAKSWSGAYNGANKTSIEDQFKVMLPPL